MSRLLDNFAGELSCLHSRQRLRQQEGHNPDADPRALSAEADRFLTFLKWITTNGKDQL